MLFSTTANAGTELQIYIGCKKTCQNTESNKFPTSTYFFGKSRKKKVCLSQEVFVDSQHIVNTYKAEGQSKEVEAGFKKAFDYLEALDKKIPDAANLEGVIKNPNTESYAEDIETYKDKSLVIELTKIGQNRLGKMTRESNKLYLVVDGLIITDLISIRPIDSGIIRLQNVAPFVFNKLNNINQ